MIPAHLPKMMLAELTAVFRRGSGMAAVGVAVAVGMVVAGGMYGIAGYMESAQVNGLPVSSMVDSSMRGVAGWALKGRNLFVLPMLLVLATASTVSGELGDQTLREILVRPVPRWSVVFSKLFSLWTLSAVTLLATLVPALVLGATAFGTEGMFEAEANLDQLLLGYAASWLSDIGLIVLAFAVSSFLRSVGGVVVIVVLFLMVDTAARGVLAGVGALANMPSASNLAEMLPGAALACWEGWNATGGFEWQPFAGLGALVVLGLGVTMVRWTRMDVP